MLIFLGAKPSKAGKVYTIVTSIYPAIFNRGEYCFVILFRGVWKVWHSFVRTYRRMNCIWFQQCGIRCSTCKISWMVRLESKRFCLKVDIHKAFNSVWYCPCHSAVLPITRKYWTGSIRGTNMFNCKRTHFLTIFDSNAFYKMKLQHSCKITSTCEI